MKVSSILGRMYDTAIYVNDLDVFTFNTWRN